MKKAALPPGAEAGKEDWEIRPRSKDLGWLHQRERQERALRAARARPRAARKEMLRISELPELRRWPDREMPPWGPAAVRAWAVRMPIAGGLEASEA